MPGKLFLERFPVHPVEVRYEWFFAWTATEENQLRSEAAKCQFDRDVVGSLRSTLGVKMPS